MKKVEITIDETGKINVSFSKDSFTHKNLRDIKRSLSVNFRLHHYQLMHPEKVINKTISEPLL